MDPILSDRTVCSVLFSSDQYSVLGACRPALTCEILIHLKTIYYWRKASEGVVGERCSSVLGLGTIRADNGSQTMAWVDHDHRCKNRFYVFNVFFILSTFLFKKSSLKIPSRRWEAPLKPQKRFNRHRL